MRVTVGPPLCWSGPSLGSPDRMLLARSVVAPPASAHSGLTGDVLPVTIEFFSDAVALLTKPPPADPAWLFVTVTLSTAMSPPGKLTMAPPPPDVAVLPLKVELRIDATPSLATA